MNIRKMTNADVEFAFHCTSSENWISETKETFFTLIEHDDNGCIIGEINSKPIGMCAATKFKTNGFIGELIIVPEERERGYGKKLFEESIQYLISNNVNNIYLDADLDAVPIYEKAGFRKICKSLRFLGKVKGDKNQYVRKVKSDDIEKIMELDCDAFEDDRSFFLRKRIEQFPDLCFVQELDNTITGYIMAQPGINIITVGPWYVSDAVPGPHLLLRHLAAEVGDIPLRLGVLESNTLALELIRSFDSLQETDPCWRMVIGESSILGMSEKLYAIGSPAKG